MVPTQLSLFPTPRVFGLYSPAMGSGKSEVAKVLVEEYGAVLVKFAGPLKDMIKVLLSHLGVPLEEIHRYVEGDLKEETIPGTHFSTRWAMQTLGTEWRDMIDRELWSKIAAARIKEIHGKGRHVVIDDMRFAHEMNVILAMNGITVRIVRPQAKVSRQHSSEGALCGFEMTETIHNNSTLDALRDRVRKMMEQYQCA